MNTISASAPPVRIRPLQTIAKAGRKLGNWSKDADIPPLVAWLAGLAFAAFVLFGRQVIGWLLHFAI